MRFYGKMIENHVGFCCICYFLFVFMSYFCFAFGSLNTFFLSSVKKNVRCGSGTRGYNVVFIIGRVISSEPTVPPV